MLMFLTSSCPYPPVGGGGSSGGGGSGGGGLLHLFSSLLDPSLNTNFVEVAVVLYPNSFITHIFRAFLKGFPI